MNKNKSSISKAQTHEDIGEYWDTHDLSEHWEETKPAEFEVDIQSEVTYFAVDMQLGEITGAECLRDASFKSE